jgi:tRNA threonylcarbamoyladenosine biosynthesis protein TsaE
MIIKLTSDSPLFTKKIGSIFSKFLKAGDLILFTGELGAGKTTFIAGVAEGLGIKENLTSPSFTILNIYSKNSKKKFVHADFYRLDTISEIENTGIEDYLYDGSYIICVEWGEKIKNYLRLNYLEINFNYIVMQNKAREINKAEEIDKSEEINIEKRIILFSSNNEYWNEKIKKFQEVAGRCTF